MSKAITFDTLGVSELLRVQPCGPVEPAPTRWLGIEYIGVNRFNMHFRSGIYPIDQWS